MGDLVLGILFKTRKRSVSDSINSQSLDWSSVNCGKWFCVKYFRRHVIENRSRDLQASNCARVSIKRGRATISKWQLLKLSKNQLEARSIATFLFTNLGSRSAAAQRQMQMNWHYTERGALTREGLSDLVLSVFTQVLTLCLRRSVDLTALAGTLSWALLIEARWLKRVGW